MNWLFPGFLAGGLLVGLPILLHFLRSKPKTVVRFPSLRLLGETAIRDTRRHRLRRWLTLALRALVIALLAAAFARPFFKNEAAARGAAVVIAVDNSMSMQATGRWETARRWALDQLDALGPGDTAGLLLMNPAPVWAVPLTDDLARVRATLAALPPGFETTRYAGTLRAAGDALAAQPARSKTLVWMADEQRLGWLGRAFDDPLPPGVKIRLASVAPLPARQAAITAARWSPGPRGEPGVEATVRLFVPEKDTRHLVVRLPGGAASAPKEIALETGTDSRVHVPLDFLPPGTVPDGVRVALTEPDDLPADDTAYLAAAPREATAVLCSAPAGGTDFLAHALESTRKLSNETPLAAVPLPAGEWPVNAVAVLDGLEAFTPPQLARLDKFVAAGGALWVFVDGSAAQADWLQRRGIRVSPCPDEGKPAHLQDWDSEHPGLAAFLDGGLLPLMDVGFERGFRLEGDDLTAVANWSDGWPAIAEGSARGQRLFLCGFPLTRAATDWPLRPSFVPFVHQSIRWLASLSSARRDWRVGDTIPLPAPGHGGWHAVDAARPEADRQVSGSVRPDVPGLYAFQAAGGTRFFAVNPPADESDLTPWPDPSKFAALESREVAAPSAGQASLARLDLSDEVAESRQRLWWWLLAFCGVGILAELALANRTAT